MKTTLPITLLVLLSLACQRQADTVYLFSFFKNNGQDGLHLAYSSDGLNWTALNNNQSYLAPTVGEAKLMRDPCIIRGGDGRFHLVWTAGWNEKGIGYAHSDDLVNWSEQQYLPVMEHEPEALNCWAPELFYDESSQRYLIYWATTIPNRFPDTDSTGDKGYNHRIYATTTEDFQAFSPTELFYDQGFNVIDAMVKKSSQEYVLFLKNEVRYPQPEKNIRIARSPQLTEDYGDASSPITPEGVWVEGPTALQIKDSWIVYYDQYIDHRMGAVRSQDLVNWEDISDQIHFPDGTRHGTVFTVSKKEFEKLTSVRP
ncbi:glycoside hydrolase family 43 protein [Lewinella sp. LCG006]|uniref:glycoside hydrolase family 43 protein n=1 Tax=Lewinella sp. LCG006 TaxID=3231911 RepID=UPI0034601CA6